MLPMLRIFRMFPRTRIVCLLHFLLALLFIVPLACAAVAERAIPDPAAGANVAAPYSSPVGGYGTMAGGSGAAPSIEDVWMRYGGARQYYSAQYSARQQYMGGASRIDPACLPLLPPMKAWGAPAPKKYTKARKPVQAANPCPETDKKTTGAAAGVSPSGEQAVAKPSQTSIAASATPESAAGTAAKNRSASATTADAAKAPNGQAVPIPIAPLKVTSPKAENPQAPIAEKPPLQ